MTTSRRSSRVRRQPHKGNQNHCIHEMRRVHDIHHVTSSSTPPRLLYICCTPTYNTQRASTRCNTASWKTRAVCPRGAARHEKEAPRFNSHAGCGTCRVGRCMHSLVCSGSAGCQPSGRPFITLHMHLSSPNQLIPFNHTILSRAQNANRGASFSWRAAPRGQTARVFQLAV